MLPEMRHRWPWVAFVGGTVSGSETGFRNSVGASLRERMAVLASASGLGVGAALLFYWRLGTGEGPLGPLAASWSTGSITLLLVMGVAFAAGVTRIIMPCGLPVLIASAVAIRGDRSPAPWAARSFDFALGGCVALGVGGAVLGALGGTLLGYAESGMERLMLARWLYTGVAAVALIFGLYELGLLRLGPLLQGPFRGRAPVATARRLPLGDHLRCTATGAFVSGGFGIACPLPTTTIAMAWVASTGNVLEGLLIGIIFGLGISLPVIGVAYMLHRGVEMTTVVRAVWSRGTLVRNLSGGAMIMFSVFTLVFWAVLLEF